MSLKIIIASIFTIIFMAGQGIVLPLFVDSFSSTDPDGTKHDANPYFVLLFTAFCITLVFGAMTIYEKVKYDLDIIPENQSMIEFFKIGMFNAVNGILLVFSSPSSRTPADLQQIFAQSVLPFTLILSYFVKNEVLIARQKIAVCIVTIGIVISLIPSIFSIAKASEGYSYKNLIWCLIFIIGNIPGAANAVYQDKVMKKQNVTVANTLLWSSIFQFSAFILLFWVDVTPFFGTTTSISNMFAELKYGFKALVTNPQTQYTSVLFVAMYVGTYFVSGVLFKNVSANYTTFLSGVSVPFAVTFWLIFPDLSSTKITTVGVILDYVSAVVVFIGILVYVTRNSKNTNDTMSGNDIKHDIYDQYYHEINSDTV
jgi:drug/metabolite transporter (DMT)-like permease